MRDGASRASALIILRQFGLYNNIYITQNQYILIVILLEITVNVPKTIIMRLPQYNTILIYFYQRTSINNPTKYSGYIIFIYQLA